MNPQLIYKTVDPGAIAWFATLLTEQATLNTEWQALIRDLTDEFGFVNGEPRALIVQEGLVGGFMAAEGEAAAAGWTFDPAWGGLIPDVRSELGRQWQSRIDDLPAQGLHDTIDLGMPSMVEVAQDGRPQGVIISTLHAPVEGGELYVLWPDRNIKPLIDEVVAASSDIVWTEVPRSVWYARVERLEAAEASQ